MNRPVTPVVMGQADGPARPLRRLALCGPVQLVIGLLVACIVPMVVHNDFRLLQSFSSELQYTSVIANACAVMLGYFIASRLGRYPSMRGLSHIMPAFLIGYGIVICVILLWRLDYSRFSIIFSFVTAQVWFHVIAMLAQRLKRPRFDIVPFGNAEGELGSIPNIRCELLADAAPPGSFRYCTDGIVADLRADLPAKWVSFLAQAALAGIPVYHWKQLGEDLTGKVAIDHLSENNLGSLLPAFFYLSIKRATDMAVVIIILPVVLPLFALIAIGIKWDSAGPVFFRQTRIGYRGEEFTMWKFRTMRTGHSNGVNERAAAMTCNGDPRITRFGCLLRKNRLDELPQIFNILRGEMSWIGPRPEALALSRWYYKEIAFYTYRHIVPPGITGWAQVNQGHVTSADDVRCKLKYDFYYIKNFSIWLDLLIALRTIAVILNGFGSR